MSLESNISAFGENTQRKIAQEKVLIQRKTLEADFTTLLLTGLGVGQIYKECYDDSFLRSIPSLTTIASSKIIEQELFPKYQLETIQPTTTVQTTQQEATNALYNAVLTAESIRQKHLLLENETQLNQYQGIIADHTTSEEKKSEIPALTHRKQNHLLIGAGGIGTYLAVLHVLKNQHNTNLDILDFDTVETTNLNRQLLYSQSIGEPKATALANALQKKGPGKITGINDKISSVNQVREYISHKKYDLIFICTDNKESRLHTSLACEKEQVQLIEGACEPYACSALNYIPGTTKPIHQQKNLQEDTPTKKQESCQEQANPSIVTTNAMAAVLMYNLLETNTHESFYNSISKEVLTC